MKARIEAMRFTINSEFEIEAQESIFVLLLSRIELLNSMLLIVS